MTIQFICNKFPFKDKEIMDFFKRHQDAFNLGDLNEIPDFSEDNEVFDFFDVLENGKRVGFVFFLPQSDSIEIELGKLDDSCKHFTDKVLSRLNELKELISQDSFEYDVDGNPPYTKWSAVVKSSNKSYEKLRYFNEKNGFQLICAESTSDSHYFERPIS